MDKGPSFIVDLVDLYLHDISLKSPQKPINYAACYGNA